MSVLVTAGLNAQEATTNAGGDFSGGGGSLSYSVGQLVIDTYQGDDGSLAQGVQQPFEISITVGIEEAKGIELSFSAFPNPTKQFLTLKVDNFDLSNLSYYLYNMNGVLLKSQKIAGKETSISMMNNVRGNYILKIISSNTEAKIFTIIKN